ncbi:MAG: LLM class F420-dependent oxidoreductase [Actinomycetota bacterium]
MRLGMTPPIEVAGMRSAIELAIRAESLGYTDVWSAEVGGTDGFTPLAALAARTEKVRLGVALAPVYTRPPALTAMSAASIQALSDGRFVLGIGVSSPAIVEGWMGRTIERPVEYVREYVHVLREALAGRKVSFEGETLHADGFRLQIEPGAPVPIHLGALGPRMCRLAGAVADGVLFFLMTPEGCREALEHVAAGAREAGRDPADLEAFVRLPTAVDEPEDLVRFMGRRLLTGYAMTPAYNASLARQGFESQASGIVEAWTAGERDRATEQFDDAMFDDLFVHGDAAACRARIEAYREAGITTPVVMPISVAGSIEERAERVTAAIEALAPAATG